MRDPIQRVISYYYFHLQDYSDPAHKFATEHTFEEWLEVSEAAQNEMTKCLSGIKSEFLPSERSFEMAKYHLRNMGFVGLTEEFDKSMAMMRHYLGVKDLDYYSEKVGHKKPKEIAPDVIEKVRQRNLMDIELYEIAKEIFKNQLAELAKFEADYPRHE